MILIYSPPPSPPQNREFHTRTFFVPCKLSSIYVGCQPPDQAPSQISHRLPNNAPDFSRRGFHGHVPGHRNVWIKFQIILLPGGGSKSKSRMKKKNRHKLFIFPRAFPKREYLAVENPHGRHGERERQKKNMFSCDRENYVHNDDDYRVGFLPTLSRDTHTHTHTHTHTRGHTYKVLVLFCAVGISPWRKENVLPFDRAINFKFSHCLNALNDWQTTHRHRHAHRSLCAHGGCVCVLRTWHVEPLNVKLVEVFLPKTSPASG